MSLAYMQSLVRFCPLVLNNFYLMNFCAVGAFITGIIVPREGGLTIALTEKLEDMVAIIFLPLVSLSSEYDQVSRDVCSLVVLHLIRSLHQFGPLKQWYDVSLF